MSSQLSTNVKQHQYWFRISLALEIHITKALLDVVHNRNNDPTYNGLSEIPVALYQYLDQNYRQTFRGLLKKGILNQDQFDLLFPTNGQTDSSKWDITLIVIVIRYCVNIPPPTNGWKKQLAVGDKSTAAGAIKAREFRNWLKHGKIDDVKTKPQFDGKWIEINEILVCLAYNNIFGFNTLETDDLVSLKEITKTFDDLVAKKIYPVIAGITALKATARKNGLYLC